MGFAYWTQNRHFISFKNCVARTTFKQWTVYEFFVKKRKDIIIDKLCDKVYEFDQLNSSGARMLEVMLSERRSEHSSSKVPTR